MLIPNSGNKKKKCKYASPNSVFAKRYWMMHKFAALLVFIARVVWKPIINYSITHNCLFIRFEPPFTLLDKIMQMLRATRSNTRCFNLTTSIVEFLNYSFMSDFKNMTYDISIFNRFRFIQHSKLLRKQQNTYLHRLL